MRFESMADWEAAQKAHARDSDASSNDKEEGEDDDDQTQSSNGDGKRARFGPETFPIPYKQAGFASFEPNGFSFSCFIDESLSFVDVGQALEMEDGSGKRVPGHALSKRHVQGEGTVHLLRFKGTLKNNKLGQMYFQIRETVTTTVTTTPSLQPVPKPGNEKKRVALSTAATPSTGKPKVATPKASTAAVKPSKDDEAPPPSKPMRPVRMCTPKDFLPTMDKDDVWGKHGEVCTYKEGATPIIPKESPNHISSYEEISRLVVGTRSGIYSAKIIGNYYRALGGRRVEATVTRIFSYYDPSRPRSKEAGVDYFMQLRIPKHGLRGPATGGSSEHDFDFVFVRGVTGYEFREGDVFRVREIYYATPAKLCEIEFRVPRPPKPKAEVVTE